MSPAMKKCGKLAVLRCCALCSILCCVLRCSTLCCAALSRAHVELIAGVELVSILEGQVPLALVQEPSAGGGGRRDREMGGEGERGDRDERVEHHRWY